MPNRRFLVLLALSAGCSPAAQSGPVDVQPPPVATPPPSETAPPKASASAAPAGNVKTMFVDSKRVPCEGEGVMECLRTKDTPDASWTLFYRTIDGFAYEPGYLYELRVEVTSASNPPADASSRRYRLVEVVSKKRMP
ncbi:MAG: DUF4377 domain-containing protein [Byssovorax sp.]